MKLTVATSPPYAVHCGSGLIGSMSSLVDFGDAERAVILCDPGPMPHWLQPLTEALAPVVKTEVLEISSGEGNKDLRGAHALLERMAELGVTRKDLVVTLGGGVASDIGGFVASIYMRGIRVVHVPTTLLGQVDAAIGGKTGVNLTKGKNLAGTFHQPAAVICDTDTLTTLTDRELISGAAEVLKYGFVFDPSILDLIADREVLLERDPALLTEIVSRCVSIKAEVVARDETEAGGRMLLNYGHTIGHAIEAAGGYGAVLHGDAISVGMVAAAEISAIVAGLSAPEVGAHRERLAALGLPIKTQIPSERILASTSSDKKRAKRQTWVLLRRLGEPLLDDRVPEEAVRRALEAVSG